MNDLIALILGGALLVALLLSMSALFYRLGYRNGFKDGTTRSNSFIHLKRAEILRTYGRN